MTTQQRPPEVLEGTGRTREMGFGSPHPGTVSAVMGDGSVQNISKSAQLNIINSLGKRGDGLTVTLKDAQ